MLKRFESYWLHCFKVSNTGALMVPWISYRCIKILNIFLMFLVEMEELECAICDQPGNLVESLFCTSCGQHYHGSCLDPPVSTDPIVRAGWQCPNCKICQTCRYVYVLLHSSHIARNLGGALPIDMTQNILYRFSKLNLVYLTFTANSGRVQFSSRASSSILSSLASVWNFWQLAWDFN